MMMNIINKFKGKHNSSFINSNDDHLKLKNRDTINGTNFTPELSYFDVPSINTDPIPINEVKIVRQGLREQINTSAYNTSVYDSFNSHTLGDIIKILDAFEYPKVYFGTGYKAKTKFNKKLTVINYDNLL